MIVRQKIIIALVLILFFHLLNNYIWLMIDRTYLTFDSHWHFILSQRIFKALRSGIFPSLHYILNNFVEHRWHGVLAGYVSAPFYFLFGSTQDSGVMINACIFFSILIFATYGICLRLGYAAAGVLAAFTLSMYPLIFNHLRVYLLDLPLTAMVTLSLYFLICANNFADIKYTTLFAVSAGLGMLTKFNFLGFIAAPFMSVMYKAVRMRRKMNILLVIFIVAIFCFPFYFIKFKEVIARVYEPSWLYSAKYYSYNPEYLLIKRWFLNGIEYFIWYMRELTNNSVGLIFLIMFTIGAVISCRMRFKHKGLLFQWLLFPIIFLAFLFHKPEIDRYSMPMLPAMAIMTGIGICNIKLRKLKVASAVLILSYGFFQYFTVSYKNPIFNRKIPINYRNDKDGFSYPADVNWMENEIYNTIVNTLSKQYKTYIFFVDNVPFVYHPVIQLIEDGGLPLKILLNSLAKEESQRDEEAPINQFSFADYVIMKEQSGIEGDVDNFISNKITETRNICKRYMNRLLLINKVVIPGKEALMIYKKKRNYLRINNNAAEVFFRDGIAKIYYQGGIELTAWRGLYFSFCYNGEQYNSMGGEWDILNYDKRKITAIGRWDGLPMRLLWRIEVSDRNAISIFVETRGEAKEYINNMSLSLVLSGKYNHWETNMTKGVFNDFPQINTVFTGKLDMSSIKLGKVRESGACLPNMEFRGAEKTAWDAVMIKSKKGERIIDFVSRRHGLFALNINIW